MNITPELVEKYAQNKCTEAEKKLMEQWLISNNDVVNTVSFDGRGKLLWHKINTHVSSSSLNTTKGWIVAASILFLVGLTTFHFFNNTTTITYQTLAAQTQIITLTDGTKVYLNANSVLKVPEEFKANIRTVSFTGEGYFEVAKDSLHPFTIKTKESKTQVLGTKFNLSAYPKENTILTLNEGKVLFSDLNNGTKNEIILLPNEQGVLANGILKKNNVNANHYKSWMDHKMYLNNETFLNVSHKMERNYGVTIQIKKTKIKKYVCKGVYDNSSLDVLLKDLSFVLRFNYKIKGKTVVIY